MFSRWRIINENKILDAEEEKGEEIESGNSLLPKKLTRRMSNVKTKRRSSLVVLTGKNEFILGL